MGAKWMRAEWGRWVHEEGEAQRKSESNPGGEVGRKILVGTRAFQSRRKILPSEASCRTACSREVRCSSNPREGSFKSRNASSSWKEPSGKEAVGGEADIRPTQKNLEVPSRGGGWPRRKGEGVCCVTAAVSGVDSAGTGRRAAKAGSDSSST